MSCGGGSHTEHPSVAGDAAGAHDANMDAEDARVPDATAQAPDATADVPHPTCTFSGVAASTSNTCGVTAHGRVWCWGDNSSGQLGTGMASRGFTAIARVQGLPGPAAEAATGVGSSCARLTDGSAWCWGNNEQGQLGDGSRIASLVPVKVTGLNDTIGMCANSLYGAAVRGDGSAWHWGNRVYYPNGEEGSPASPIPVPTLQADVMGAACGWAHTCFLRRDGSIWCWGAGPGLGDGVAMEYSVVPVKARLPLPATRVAAGNRMSCAILSDESLWCWGGYDGAGSVQYLPVAMMNLGNVSDVCVGDGYGCAIRTDGAVWCWGFNGNGQLGSIGPASTGRPVPGLPSPARKLACATWHACAITDDGTITCWGSSTALQAGGRQGVALPATEFVCPSLE